MAERKPKRSPTTPEGSPRQPKQAKTVSIDDLPPEHRALFEEQERTIASLRETIGDRTLASLWSLKKGELKVEHAIESTMSSHTYPPNQEASCVEEHLDLDVEGVDLDSLGKNMSSLLTFLSNGYDKTPDHRFPTATVNNETEVAELVKQAAVDALQVIRVVLGANYPSGIRLSLERSLLSQKLDVLVVLVNAVPILAIQVKKMQTNDGKLKSNKHVLGQCYDYACMVKAFGHRMPMLVLTTIEETIVCSVEEKHGGHGKQRHESPVTPKGARQPNTPSTLLPPPTVSSDEGSPSSPNPCFEADKQNPRTLKISQSFGSHQLLQVLYSQISKAIATAPFQRMPTIVPLEAGKCYCFSDALLMTKEGYFWGKLTVQLGRAISWTKKNGSDPAPGDEAYFVIGFLGFGSTANVYHALDKNGKQVALKVWMRCGPLEEDLDLPIEGQKRNILSVQHNELVSEQESLKKLYPFLETEVRATTLFEKFPCLVMPLFPASAKK